MNSRRRTKVDVLWICGVTLGNELRRVRVKYGASSPVQCRGFHEDPQKGLEHVGSKQ
jgi:hypothetical protein